MSLLVIPESLGMLVNNLIADDMYSGHGRENLQQPIQMQLSKKKKFFSKFFTAFLKST